MKRVTISAIFIVLFTTYAVYLHTGETVTATNTQTASVADTQTLAQTDPSQNTASAPTSDSNTQQKVTLAQATPADLPKGKYKDGTYTGPSTDAFYGNVQVRVTVSGGKIADVAFLSYPNDRSTSRMINGQAMPLLKQQAIAAQSAQVDGVSGATDTSEAFRQSLSGALTSAKV